MAINSKKGGFTLIEVLVVIMLFAVIAVVTTQSLIRIIGNTASSSSSTRARENLEYALSVVDRSVKNAKQINSCTSSPMRVEYVSHENQIESVECTTFGNGNIEHNGEPLISNEVEVSTCTLTCITPAGGSIPSGVQIHLGGSDAEGSYETPPIQLQTTIMMRSY